MLRVENMTLAQAKGYCDKNRKNNCGELCELRKRNICGYGCAIDVFQWNLDVLTPTEIEICKALGAKWVSMGLSDHSVDIWADNPSKGIMRESNDHIGILKCFALPSIRPGDCICVEDLYAR